MMEADKQACNWAMLCHLVALVAYVGIPFGHIIGPLVVWLIKKDEYAFVDDQGKESLNFQISMTIYGSIAAILCFTCFIVVGAVLFIVIAVADIVLITLAAVSASGGKAYRYPLTIRFIN